MALTDEQIDGLCSEWLYVAPSRTYEEHRPFARAIESAACAERDKQLAERDARIAELERQLAEAHKDAERYRWLKTHQLLAKIQILPTTSGPSLDTAIDAAMKEQT